MPIPYDSAVDELFSTVKAVWDTTSSVMGYVPEIRWPGVPEPAKPDQTKLWARVSVQTVTDGQSSLSDQAGKRRYRAVGLLYIQLFCSRSEVNSLGKGREVSKLVQAKFRQASLSGALTYRDQKIVEIPPTNESYPINVVVTFEYDTIQ